jgi:hypothetical protein
MIEEPASTLEIRIVLSPERWTSTGLYQPVHGDFRRRIVSVNGGARHNRVRAAAHGAAVHGPSDRAPA